MINTDKNYIYSDLTDRIIGTAYRVFNELGAGFLEKVYENALRIELETEGLVVYNSTLSKSFINQIWSVNIVPIYLSKGRSLLN